MSFPHRELALLVLLTAGRSDRLTAQVTWTGRLGATKTSTMVTDQLGSQSIKLAPGIQPTLGFEASVPLRTSKTPVDASFELQVTTGTLQRTEGGTTTDLATIRTIGLTAGIAGKIASHVRWRLGAGLLSYATSEHTSVFQEGDPMRFLSTFGLEYRRPLTSTYTLSGLVRYDLHGFTTRQLETSGYTGSQMVHRLTIGVGVSR